MRPEQRIVNALADIIDAAGAADRLVQRGREAYDADEMLRFAAEAITQRIGEAVGRLPESFVTEHSTTASWRAIRGMRNLVTHEYRRIDYDLLWRALAHRLPGEARRIRALHERLRYPVAWADAKGGAHRGRDHDPALRAQRLVGSAQHLWHDCGMSRTRLSTTVDADLLQSARKATGKPDSALVDEALNALLARYRSAEVDARYAAYDAHPLDEPDAWGDLASFRRAASAS